MGKDIKHYREEIDRLDQHILELLNSRAKCAQEIGEIKKGMASPVFHPERENQVIQNLINANQGPLLNASITHIWREVMSACRALEEKVRIAFFGPHGTFTEEAAVSYFGSSVDLEACATIDDVFKAVSNSNCRFGIVPIENSTEGGIGRSLDLLQQSSLKIIGEQGLNIRHQLLSNSKSLNEIEVVYGHPQALAQCQVWLKENLPHARKETVASNSEGAKLAATQKNTAAIAGVKAAALYGLPVLAQGIQDVSNNRTRFIVLARQEELQAPVKDEKAACTSIVVSVPNKPGAVHDLLVPLKKHHVTLTRLESRPAKSEQWEYFFYMDIDGHIEQPAVAQALQEVKEMCTFYKMLGSYSVRKEAV